MLYFDTNILVYSVADQGSNRTKLSKQLIEEAINSNIFYISSLVLSEFIFTLSKLKILDKNNKAMKLYSKFCKNKIDKEIVLQAYEKCKKLNKCRNINDFIHLEIANTYCSKLMTFDNDFKNLEKFYDIEIDILKD